MTRISWIAVAMLSSTTMARAQTASVAGIVQDAATARPLIGAVVTVGGRSTRTDASGTFQVASIPHGTVVVNVRRLGYEPASRTLLVDGDKQVTITLNRIAALDTVQVRAAPQAIYGAVATAHDLRPLPGATVQIFGATPAQVSTDSTGHFFYAVKSPGAYLVRAKLAGLTAQTVSVTVNREEGVEVALLLDSLEEPRANAMEVAFAEFRERLLRRTSASAVVPRAELQGNGTRDLVSSLLTAHSFASRPLRFTSTACVFVDGEARGGVSPNAFDPRDIETVELYAAAADRSETLARHWPPGMPCGDTGMPRSLGASGRSGRNGSERANDLVRWVVIWLKR